MREVVLAVVPVVVRAAVTAVSVGTGLVSGSRPSERRAPSSARISPTAERDESSIVRSAPAAASGSRFITRRAAAACTPIAAM